ncbi:hypothetical protein EB810_13980 [Altererythrobacter sp. FM1]|uniref:hypothetical protein n=1 Tax=Tsuneonella flava TaxID=2055955 RepID=UPI000C7FF088|nr:hypothetical protein [Tsuneonella flava]ROT94174.1 hypothetical protein EB810_13980 [Altererythrobacter sp. FM1]
MKILIDYEIGAVNGGRGSLLRAAIKAIDWIGRGLTVAEVAKATKVDIKEFGEFEQKRTGGNMK